jgi:hypothetical protein
MLLARGLGCWLCMLPLCSLEVEAFVANLLSVLVVALCTVDSVDLNVFILHAFCGLHIASHP